MGYLVGTSGRLLLPESLEPQVLTVLEVELLRHDGWLRENDVEAVDSLGDLARFIGTRLVRDGDWLVVSADPGGDPTWSAQATAFYAGLARWVLQGEVHVRGEDGQEWSYRYTPNGMVQDGGNGWDGSPGEPGSSPTGPPQAPRADLRAPEPPAPVPPPEPGAWADPSPAQQDFWADDDRRAERGGRTLAMTLLLVTGVLLIIGVAFLAAGMVG